MKAAASKLILFSICTLMLSSCALPYDKNPGAIQETPAAETVQATQLYVESVPEPTPEPTPEILYLNIPSGDYKDRFECEQTGQWLDYWTYVPENAQENLPLIVYLHGDGMSSRIDWLPDYDIAKMTKEVYGYEFPFILLTPNNRYPEWYEDGMGTTVKSLIDHVADMYKCDREKIIITGHSRGAIATWQMVDEFGDYFSCAVPVSCGTKKIKCPENFINVPVKAFVGTGPVDHECYRNDMSYFVKVVNSAGGLATLTELEGHDHDTMCTAPYTLELFEWMIKQ